MASRRSSGTFSVRAAASTRPFSPETMKAWSTAFFTATSSQDA